MSYCAAPSQEGWICVLLAGHRGPHASVDNRRMWKGTPGYPVVWTDQQAEAQPTSVGPPMRPVPTPAEAHRYARELGFDGEICGNCGSPNTRRVGRCVRCDNCGESSACS